MANHPIVKPATTHTNEMRTPAGRPGERESERASEWKRERMRVCERQKEGDERSERDQRETGDREEIEREGEANRQTGRKDIATQSTCKQNAHILTRSLSFSLTHQCCG